MAEAGNEWLRSFAAVKKLREAGVVDPVGTLARLAETQQVRSRAARLRLNGADSDEAFPQERYIPEEFWRCVNNGAAGTVIDGDAGVFATNVIYNPENGDHSDSDHIWLSGVTFHADDLTAIFENASEGGGSASPKPNQGKNRAPSVKKGRPPSNEKILAKADEMHAQGMKARDIAKEIHKVPGFENVGTVEARALLNGRWPRGRRKKTEA